MDAPPPPETSSVVALVEVPRADLTTQQGIEERRRQLDNADANLRSLVEALIQVRREWYDHKALGGGNDANGENQQEKALSARWSALSWEIYRRLGR